MRSLSYIVPSLGSPITRSGRRTHVSPEFSERSMIIQREREKQGCLPSLSKGKFDLWHVAAGRHHNSAMTTPPLARTALLPPDYLSPPPRVEAASDNCDTHVTPARHRRARVWTWPQHLDDKIANGLAVGVDDNDQ